MRRDEIRGRFKDAPWYDNLSANCIVGGAGGIGSWLSFLLARAGFTPILYDYDEIELHNMGGQLFGTKDIGKCKTEAMEEFIKEYADIEISTFEGKYDEESMTGLYVFSAFDNMKARKDMFENWYEANKENPYAVFIDGRLLFEQLTIFCVTPDKADKYREHLFDDSEIEAENCTMKQTSHSASLIASLMVGFFTNHVTNAKSDGNPRHVPFRYEYFIPLNMADYE